MPVPRIARGAWALALALLLGVLPGATVAAQAALPPLPHYRLDAQLRYAQASLDVVETVRYPNLTGVPLDRLVFQVTPAYYGSFTLRGASVGDAQIATTLDGTILEAPLPAPLQPGDSVELRLDFTLVVPHQQGRFGAGPRALALGNWFPILAPYRDGWFRHQYVDIGDAFFTEVANFDVSVTADQDLVVAHSGTELAHSGRQWQLHADAVRDFALAVSPGFKQSDAQAGTTRVRVYALQAEHGPIWAEIASRYLSWYGDTLGAYPYPELDVVEVDLPASYGGMEYPGLVMLEADSRLAGNLAGNYPEYLAAHEIAHQWFYSLVGDDQIHDPWLDEAFATYLPLLYDRLARPALFPSDWIARVGGGYDQRVAAAGNLPASSGLDDFYPESPYFTIVYRKGAHYLGGLDDALGDQAFVQLLRDYVATYGDKVATPRAFLDLAQQHATQDLNALGAAHFAYGNLTYPSAPRWTLTLPPGPLHGQVAIGVSADFKVANLELLLDDRTLYSGTSPIPTLDLAGVAPGEYLLLARLTDDQGALLERGVRVTVQ